MLYIYFIADNENLDQQIFQQFHRLAVVCMQVSGG